MSGCEAGDEQYYRNIEISILYSKKMKFFSGVEFIRTAELDSKAESKYSFWRGYHFTDETLGLYGCRLNHGEALVSLSWSNLGTERAFELKLICESIKEVNKDVEIRRPKDEPCYEQPAYYIVDCNTMERQANIRRESSAINLMMSVKITSPVQAIKFSFIPKQRYIGRYLDRNLEHQIRRLKSLQKGLESDYETTLANNLNLEYKLAGIEVDYLKMAISRRHEKLDDTVELIAALEEKGFTKEQIVDIISQRTKQTLEIKKYKNKTNN